MGQSAKKAALPALCLLCLVSTLAYAGTPAAAITASPVQGAAPLGVFFDGRGSLEADSFFWNFGDGLTSTDSNVTHIYTVAGTYVATLVVKNTTGKSAPAQVKITVTGPGEGVVAPGMNFRIAPFASTFKINRGQPNADSFALRGVFNTVDLPRNLRSVAISFAIGGNTVFSGFLDQNFEIVNPTSQTKPSYFAYVNVRDQLFNIDIKKASLAASIPGATDESIPSSAPKQVPVTITLTIGAETYTFTQSYSYTAVKGSVGNGKFDLTKKATTPVGDGFFVVSQASAVEVPEEKAHFYEIRGYLSEPMGFSTSNNDLLVKPTAGNITVTLNSADKIVIPFDRFAQTGTKFAYLQPDRQIGGVRSMIIDPLLRTISFSTWDIKSLTNEGGTGLPARGQPFTSFDFTLRLDIDQPSPTGTVTFGVVTDTRLSRKSTDDAFWQTGRKITRQ